MLQHRYILSERVGRLKVAEHQLGVKKALDKSDAALLSEVRGKLVPHHIA